MPFSTDKVSLGYLPTYLRIASEIGPTGRVCELGVFAGGSLQMWQTLFPYGLVVGVDKDAGARWPDGAIQIVAPQTEPSLPETLRGISPEYDLVVDDASHDGELTAQSFALLWPLVVPRGFYVIEDWMVGYPAWANHDDSMVTMARSMLDLLAEKEGDVDTITYRYGQIVIRRK